MQVALDHGVGAPIELACAIAPEKLPMRFVVIDRALLLLLLAANRVLTQIMPCCCENTIMSSRVFSWRSLPWLAEQVKLPASLSFQARGSSLNRPP